MEFFFLVGGLIVAVWIGIAIYYLYNYTQPTVTRAATVVSKRSAVKHDPQQNYTQTLYYCTFEIAVKGRAEYRVSTSKYAVLVEGDRGELDTKGSLFWDFRQRNEAAAASPRLMAFLFTDLVDSTGMKQRLGDTTYVQAVLRPHNKLFHDALGKFATAVERDNAGDGFFVTFDSLAEAVEFALVFQRGMETFGWVQEHPKTRIGIHLGDSIKFQEAQGQEKAAGQAQDLAARLMGLASGGQILLSRAVSDGARQYVRKHPVSERAPGASTELAWVGHGAYQLKGRDEPIEVFEVGSIGHAPLRAPADSEKAWRVVRGTSGETVDGDKRSDAEPGAATDGGGIARTSFGSST